jgi:SAM-dependent methyltransferase
MYRAEVDARREGFDNDSPDAPEQLRLLSDILNEHTFSVFEEIGVSEGWHCWDIGAGDGSVARWLAERVGAAGYVTASDLKPDHIPSHPRMEAVRHDVTADPLPGRRFDLVHARLVLMHLVDREDIAIRLATCVRPGGVLVLTDWHCDCAVVVKSPVDGCVEEIWQRYHDAVHDLGQRSGMDLIWASRASDVLRDAGYQAVTTRRHRASGRGGTPSALLARLHTFMLESHLADSGKLSAEELAVIHGNLLDPGFEMATYHTYTTVVRV